jgi:hypothetical protein
MMKKKLVPFVLPQASPRKSTSPRSPRNSGLAIRYDESGYVNMMDSMQVAEKTFGSAEQRHRGKQILRQNEILKKKIENVKKSVDNTSLPFGYQRDAEKKKKLK